MATLRRSRSALTAATARDAPTPRIRSRFSGSNCCSARSCAAAWHSAAPRLCGYPARFTRPEPTRRIPSRARDEAPGGVRSALGRGAILVAAVWGILGREGFLWPMGVNVIISYDGTANDDDALALGRMLAPAGFTLALAYVRHSREFDSRREDLAQHDAEQRLERGAAMLGDPEVARHVVFGASTGAGLGLLAEREGASVVVFGSDCRTAPGHVEPGTSAQDLLNGGSVAVAIAAAGLRTRLD